MNTDSRSSLASGGVGEGSSGRMISVGQGDGPVSSTDRMSATSSSPPSQSRRTMTIATVDVDDDPHVHNPHHKVGWYLFSCCCCCCKYMPSFLFSSQKSANRGVDGDGSGIADLSYASDGVGGGDTAGDYLKQQGDIWRGGSAVGGVQDSLASSRRIFLGADNEYHQLPPREVVENTARASDATLLIITALLTVGQWSLFPSLIVFFNSTSDGGGAGLSLHLSAVLVCGCFAASHVAATVCVGLLTDDTSPSVDHAQKNSESSNTKSKAARRRTTSKTALLSGGLAVTVLSAAGLSALGFPSLHLSRTNDSRASSGSSADDGSNLASVQVATIVLAFVLGAAFSFTQAILPVLRSELLITATQILTLLSSASSSSAAALSSSSPQLITTANGFESVSFFIVVQVFAVVARIVFPLAHGGGSSDQTSSTTTTSPRGDSSSSSSSWFVSMAVFTTLLPLAALTLLLLNANAIKFIVRQQKQTVEAVLFCNKDSSSGGTQQQQLHQGEHATTTAAAATSNAKRQTTLSLSLWTCVVLVLRSAFEKCCGCCSSSSQNDKGIERAAAGCPSTHHLQHSGSGQPNTSLGTVTEQDSLIGGGPSNQQGRQHQKSYTQNAQYNSYTSHHHQNQQQREYTGFAGEDGEDGGVASHGVREDSRKSEIAFRVQQKLLAARRCLRALLLLVLPLSVFSGTYFLVFTVWFAQAKQLSGIQDLFLREVISNPNCGGDVQNLGPSASSLTMTPSAEQSTVFLPAANIAVFLVFVILLRKLLQGRVDVHLHPKFTMLLGYVAVIGASWYLFDLQGKMATALQHAETCLAFSNRQPPPHHVGTPAPAAVPAEATAAYESMRHLSVWSQLPAFVLLSFAELVVQPAAHKFASSASSSFSAATQNVGVGGSSSSSFGVITTMRAMRQGLSLFFVFGNLLGAALVSTNYGRDTFATGASSSSATSSVDACKDLLRVVLIAGGISAAVHCALLKFFPDHGNYYAMYPVIAPAGNSFTPVPSFGPPPPGPPPMMLNNQNNRQHQVSPAPLVVPPNSMSSVVGSTNTLGAGSRDTSFNNKGGGGGSFTGGVSPYNDGHTLSGTTDVAAGNRPRRKVSPRGDTAAGGAVQYYSTRKSPRTSTLQ